MRPFILVAAITTALVAPGCWVGPRRGPGPQQPIAHYQRYDRPGQQGPRDHDRRDDDRRDDRRGDRH
jgi:hypothetical protein